MKTIIPAGWRRRLAIASIVLLGMFTAGELFCRFYLGLGDPPLSKADSQIEYLFKPNQNCRRFGNTVKYNAWSMRSDDFPARKTDRNEYRVMVFGDSVVNGGSLTDQSKLATAILQKRLSADLKRPVIVGNISAGSWGPPNMLAYARKFGLFEADVVVIVLSSHDYADAPTFVPTVGVHPGFPEHKPWCAMWEAVTRYLPGYLHSKPAPGIPTTASTPPQRNIDECLAALRELIQMARSSGARVLLAQHLEKPELSAAAEYPGHAAIAAVAAEMGVPCVQFGPAFRRLRDAGRDPYRENDNIHPNEIGQAAMAEVLAGWWSSSLSSGSE